MLFAAIKLLTVVATSSEVSAVDADATGFVSLIGETLLDIILCLAKRWNTAVFIDICTAGVVCRKRKRGIAVVPGKQLGDQIRTAHDILVGVVGICDTERCCGGRHQLHDTDGTGAADSACIKIGLCSCD